MPSFAAHLIKVYARLAIKRRSLNEHDLLRHLRRRFNHNPLPVRWPKGIHHDIVTMAGIKIDRVRPIAPQATVLYIHGGGFVAGTTRTYFSWAGHVAQALKADVYLPRYRLAPEFAYPTALDDVQGAYAELLRAHPERPIIVAGDSAGGALMLALLLRLRDQAISMPVAGIAYSPYANLTTEPPSRITCQHSDDMLSLDMLHTGRNFYLQGHDAHDPYASPSFGDFTGLPPLWLSASEHECLRDDCLAVANQAQHAGIKTELVLRPHMPHVWPIFYPLLPEARVDMQRVLDFISLCVKPRHSWRGYKHAVDCLF